MNVCKVSNVSQLVNHQLLVNLSFLIMSVMSLRSTVLANLSKHLMLLKLSVPVMQVILSFVIPLVSLFLFFVSDCQSVKLARKLIEVSRKRPHERFVNNKNSRQHDFTKPFSAVNILMMPIYFYELVPLFFIFHHNFCNNNVNNSFEGYVRCNNFSVNKFLASNSVSVFNIPFDILSSSVHFYQFSFSFYEYSFFRNSVFYNIFKVNSVTIILNNDFCITIYLTGMIGFYFAIIK